MAVGSTTQFALAGYHEDGSPDTTLNPANTTAANAANLSGRHGRAGPDRRARRHAAGPPARGGLEPDAERAEPQRDRPPRRRRPRAAGRGRGDLGAGRARPRGPARPDRRLRRVRLDRSRRAPIAKYEWDIDGDGTFERTGVKVLGSYPAPDGRRRDPARHRRRRADRRLRRDASRVAGRPGADRRVHQPRHGAGRGQAVPARRAGARTPTAASSPTPSTSTATARYETGPSAFALATTTFLQKGPATVGVRVTDDEGATATAKLSLTVKDAPCVDNPVIKVERAVIVTQGADVAGGAGCFHGVTTDKSGVRTTVWTTSGHFRVNGLEVDTLAASEATLEWKRKLTGDKETISLKLVAPKAKVEGTAKQTDFMFHEGSINWEPGRAPRSPASSSTPTPASAACR